MAADRTQPERLTELVFEAAGERIHPASAHLVSESGHLEQQAGEHDLHRFPTLRDMDEILVANVMLFHDVVTVEPYDLVVGDESWEVDHFLHENPELKRFAYAWFTDFVGMLPMPGSGRGPFSGSAVDAQVREEVVAADVNAEMIEHIERFPHVRDRAIFVGEPDDIVPLRFGPDLPMIREWTQANHRFSGYVPELYRHLAACDLAIVQGGLTTCMELTATQRPFISIPLRHPFEQNHHVVHRLERSGAGRRLDYDDAGRAAAMLADLL